MSFGIPNSPRRDSRGFQKVVDAFLNCDGLAFAEILSAERILLPVWFSWHLQDGDHGLVVPLSSVA